MKNAGMILMLALAMMWCSSCEEDEGLVIPNNEPTYVAPELKGYLEEFVQEANQRGLNLDLSGLVLALDGVAHPDNNASCRDKIVMIDRETYDTINRLCYRGVTPFLDWRFKVMIFHQLGHCLLNRPHLNDTGANGIPLSIMHAEAVEELDMTGLEEDLFFDELFTNANL